MENSKTDISEELEKLAESSRLAFREFSAVSSSKKNDILERILTALSSSCKAIFEANQMDLRLAEAAKQSLVKRLDLFGNLIASESIASHPSSSPKWKSLLNGIRDVAKMPDPIGQKQFVKELDEGLILEKVTCPIGVILIIFEARPEVVVQISSLCIKSGNAVILKGGKEARYSNEILVKVIKEALGPEHSDLIQYVSDREAVGTLLGYNDFIDLVIPRGSNELVRSIKEKTSIPVLGHADGICSIYVDSEADVPKAIKIIIDSKTNYPAACNSAEMILIHREIREKLLKPLLESLEKNGVITYLEPSLFSGDNKKAVIKATENEFFHEFLDKKLTIWPVNDMEEAISLIHKYGSGHTDCIISENEECAEDFLKKVDSAGVYWNASTRFADGYRYGFGAEIGVSTNRVHARGPVGLDGLCIYKYVLRGSGQIVQDYQTGSSSFTHKLLQ